MASAGSYQPAWYPDPSGQHQYRYYDGTGWTVHVATNGQQGTAPLTPTDPGASGGRSAQAVQADVHRAKAAGSGAVGNGNLFGEPVLVVSQRAKLIEVSNEYAIYDQHGSQIGAIRQVGQNTARKALRFLTTWDQFLTHNFQIVDGAGQVVLMLTRPSKVFKSRVLVQRGDGGDIGEIKQQNVFGKISFVLEAGGAQIGSINAENWRAWNFNIQDADGQELARVTKTFEGLAKAVFTTADNYVVQIHRPLDEPLRSMVVAAALCIDTALKQDEG